MDFELQKEDLNSNARAGLITTAHGTIETPIFMPVGTVGSVKAVHSTNLKTTSRPRLSWATHITCICVREWTS